MLWNSNISGGVPWARRPTLRVSLDATQSEMHDDALFENQATTRLVSMPKERVSFAKSLHVFPSFREFLTYKTEYLAQHFDAAPPNSNPTRFFTPGMCDDSLFGLVGRQEERVVKSHTIGCCPHFLLNLVGVLFLG